MSWFQTERVESISAQPVEESMEEPVEDQDRGL
jgi:hypothetical protein